MDKPAPPRPSLALVAPQSYLDYSREDIHKHTTDKIYRVCRSLCIVSGDARVLVFKRQPHCMGVHLSVVHFIVDPPGFVGCLGISLGGREITPSGRAIVATTQQLSADLYFGSS